MGAEVTFLALIGLILVVGLAAGGVVTAIERNTAVLSRIHKRLNRLPRRVVATYADGTEDYADD